jgi:hypothetical protein
MISILGFPDGSTATLQYLARASGPARTVRASADGRRRIRQLPCVTQVVGGGAADVQQDKGQENALTG